MLNSAFTQESTSFSSYKLKEATLNSAPKSMISEPPKPASGRILKASFGFKGNDKPKAEGNFTPAAEGSFIPTDFKSLTPEEIIKRLPGAEIDKDGKVTINGKPVKKILVDGKDVVTEGSLKDPINVKIDDSDIMRITTKSKK